MSSSVIVSAPSKSASVGDVGRTTLCEYKVLPGLIDLLCIFEDTEALCFSLKVATWLEAAAEYPNMVEHIDVLQAGLKSFHATH